MKDYVLTKKLPIPELLCAFDIMLVRTILSHLSSYTNTT